MQSPRILRKTTPTLIGFLMLCMAASGVFALAVQRGRSAAATEHILRFESGLNDVRALADEAETGQRGYLLTGIPAYLLPYEAARRQLVPSVDQLDAMTETGLDRKLVAQLRLIAQLKLEELHRTIELRRVGDGSRGMDVVRSGSGELLMDRLRTVVSRLRVAQRFKLRASKVAENNVSSATGAIMLLSGFLIILLAWMTHRDTRRRMEELLLSKSLLEAEIAERTSAEAQVRQLQKMEALGQLTGGIAHDFNNMLAIVIGSLDIARRRLTGAEHHKLPACIEAAMEGARRAAVLTSRLLAFSRKQTLDPAVIDPNRLISGMSELLRRALGETIAIEIVLGGGIWRTHADVSQLENALLNLAVNARDAMPGGGRLTIETSNAHLDECYAARHSEVAAGQYVLISVSDTGSGMTAEVMQKAFEPFYTTKDTGMGTGLGLSQIFGFVKQSRGHVKIYSEVGYGTTVKAYLPRFTGTDEIAEVKGAEVDVPRAERNEMILVVEDEDEVRKVSVEMLRELGYSTLHASSPVEALRMIGENSSIRLLFTDIVMPGMTGKQLADAALEAMPHLKVLYTTGYTRNAVVHNGVLDPGSSLLPKPFTLDQIARKVRDVLDGI